MSKPPPKGKDVPGKRKPVQQRQAKPSPPTGQQQPQAPKIPSGNVEVGSADEQNLSSLHSGVQKKGGPGPGQTGGPQTLKKGQSSKAPSEQRPQKSKSTTDSGQQTPADRPGSSGLQRQVQEQSEELQKLGLSAKSKVTPVQMDKVIKKLNELEIKSIEEPTKNFQKSTQGLCSVFSIDIEKDRRAYRYDVLITMYWEINNGSLEKNRKLTGGGDDGRKALHRNMCRELFSFVYETLTQHLGMGPDGRVVYDRSGILFSSEPIEYNAQEYNITRLQLNAQNHRYVMENCADSARFTVKISQNAQRPVLDLNELGQYISGRSKFNEDRSLRTFLEMATSQHALNQNVYAMISSGRLFETNGANPNGNDDPALQEAIRRLGYGITLRPGVAKGVRVVKCGGGKSNVKGPSPAVVLDVKISAFFKAQNLLQTLQEIFGASGFEDWEKATKLLVGIRVQVRYNRSRTFTIGRISNRSLTVTMIKLNNEGREVSVAEYFLSRYNIRLGYPQYPGIIPSDARPGQDVEYFPIEELLVMDGQRVIREKMEALIGAGTNDNDNQILVVNTMPPGIRYAKILEHARRLMLFGDDNPILSAFGIHVLQNSNGITPRIRPLPRIEFAKKNIVIPNADTGKWPTARAQYLDTTQLRNWVVLCEERSIRDAKDFIERFLNLASEKGMRIAKPEIEIFASPRGIEPNPDEIKQWDEKFTDFTKREPEPECILLLDSFKKKTHGLLKLLEVYYKIRTQHVTIEKVWGIIQRGQRQTLENILNKFNCKNFGLNYRPLVPKSSNRFALENGKVLMIGYDVSHPGASLPFALKAMLRNPGLSDVDSLDQPSIVGICANMAKNPHNFVGDYFYQLARKESVDEHQLSAQTKRILENVAKNRPQDSLPPFIFVLRDGISEGQFSMAYFQELEAIRKGCRDFKTNYSPKITFVIGTKRHFKRMFVLKDGKDQYKNGILELENLAPGSVVENANVVRADVTEFFMQAHSPVVQKDKVPCTKPVQYSVPHNEINITSDELQDLLLSLCYSHQIVNSPISIPEPVYQADELAKRGNNNFKALKRFYPNFIPMNQHDVMSQDGRHTQFSVIDVETLTQQYSYQTWMCGETRLTA